MNASRRLRNGISRFDRGFLAVTLDRKTCRCSGARLHWRGRHQRQILCCHYHRQYRKLYEVQL